MCQLRSRKGEKPPFFPHGSGIPSLRPLPPPALPKVSWQSITGPPSEVWARVLWLQCSKELTQLQIRISLAYVSQSPQICIFFPLLSPFLLPSYLLLLWLSVKCVHSIKVITVLPTPFFSIGQPSPELKSLVMALSSSWVWLKQSAAFHTPLCSLSDVSSGQQEPK